MRAGREAWGRERRKRWGSARVDAAVRAQRLRRPEGQP